MSQMQLEEHFHLPSTVKPSTNPLGEAKSQIFFITNFAKPLLDLTAQAIPGKPHETNQSPLMLIPFCRIETFRTAMHIKFENMGNSGL